ncbi:MAG: hypothetical protein LBC98_10835 [Prevotellaceae bacterium]|jgi:hypothetical protein|nr:hypothetical protein [Prevotellaceae bacterium]
MKFKHFAIAMITAAGLYACGPKAEDVLKKYESHGEMETDANKAGISCEVSVMKGFWIKYSSSLLNTDEDLIGKLAQRWFVADAENPAVKLPAKIEVLAYELTKNGVAQPTTYGHLINIDSIKAKFLLIGFEGISPIESTEVETQPLFFLAEKNKDKNVLLTPAPRLASELFTPAYEPMFFSEQEYAGEILFEGSKNVNLYFTCSADLKQITTLKLSAEKLHLPLKYSNNQDTESDEKNTFRYSDNSIVSSSLNKDGYMTNCQVKGGVESVNPIEIKDSKIRMKLIPVICDLTVTNACIYGTLKVGLNGFETKSVYVVFKNITTPQEIPENILNESK